MKKILYLLLLFILHIGHPVVAQTQRATAVAKSTYTNPLPVKFGDPYVIYTNGTYYMYGTGGVEKGFAAYKSEDLVNWMPVGQVYYGDVGKSWGIHSFWAPEVYELNNRYYLFYSAQWKENPTNELENFRIGVAVADKPEGPFIDVSSRPLFDPGYPIIDANVFFDTDGRMYLYFSRCCYKHPVKSEIADWVRQKGWYNYIEESWVYGIELKPDLSGVIGQPALLLRPPVTMNDKQAEWESRSVLMREVTAAGQKGP